MMGCLENRHSPLPTTPLGTCVERSGVQHGTVFYTSTLSSTATRHQHWAATYLTHHCLPVEIVMVWKGCLKALYKILVVSLEPDLCSNGLRMVGEFES